MRNDRILDMGSLNPFYEYHDNVYFATAYQNTVYKLTKKDCILFTVGILAKMVLMMKCCKNIV